MQNRDLIRNGLYFEELVVLHNLLGREVGTGEKPKA